MAGNDTMTNHDWIETFRMIPKEQHNVLVLTTLSGMDLAIEQVMRTELSFLVFRGRVVGNTDEGRVFFLPYRQIDFLQINRTVKEDEVRQMFGEKPTGALNGSPASSQSGFTTITAASGAFPPPPASGIAPAPAPAPTQVRPAAPSPARIPPGVANSPSIAARLSNIPAAALQPPPPVSARLPNVPATALVPPGGQHSIGDQPAPPRNSILERLRAQRNSILPPRPPVR